MSERYVGRYRCRDVVQHRTGDADPVGEHVGSHPQGCKFSQDDDGTLHVTTPRGQHLCDYAPAQYEMHEDGNLVRVHRVGEHDASRYERVPSRDRAVGSATAATGAGGGVGVTGRYRTPADLNARAAELYAGGSGG